MSPVAKASADAAPVAPAVPPTPEQVAAEIMKSFPKTMPVDLSTLLPIIAALIVKANSFVDLDEATQKKAILIVLHKLAQGLPAPENLFVPSLVDQMASGIVDTIVTAANKADDEINIVLGNLVKPKPELPSKIDAIHKHFF